MNGSIFSPFSPYRTPGETPVAPEDNRPTGSKPNFEVHEQLPALSWQATWTQADVDGALRQHAQGQFSQSAMLMDAMSCDDAIDAVVSARVDGLLGLDRIVEPAKKGHRGGNKRIAKDIDGRWEEFFPRHVIRQIKRWELFMGFAIAQIVWHANDDATEWLPRIEPWHPMYLYADPMTMRFYAVTTRGPVPIEEGTGQWLFYAPNGRRYAWTYGAIRSLAVPWLARQYAWRDWVRWSEVYSLGIRKAIFPTSANAATKRKFFSEIAALGSNTTVGLEQDATGKGYDVDVVFPASTAAADGFDKLLSKSEAKIAILVNGQNLTTEIKGGSYAAALVHQNVKHDKLAADSVGIGACLGRDVVKPFIVWHDYPTNTEAPEMGYDVEPPEDRKAKADVLNAVGTAIGLFAVNQVPVSVPKILEDYDVPVAEEPDELPKPPLNAAPAPGPGTPQPPEGDPAAIEPGTPGEPANGPPGVPTPPSLLPPRPPPRRAPSPSSPPARVSLSQQARVPSYADDVTATGARYAGAALKPYLAKVLQAIETGESFEDVRRRVLAEYRDTKPDKRLEDIVHATHVMTHAAGAFDATPKDGARR